VNFSFDEKRKLRKLEQNYLKKIKKEFAHIKPYDEDDLDWWNEGLDFIEQDKLDEAEKIFKMLIVSQPHHSDGFEGLAMVYKKMDRKKEAMYFIDLAVEKAREALQAERIEQEILEMILHQKKEIEKI
jgi:tetratricopeptide (TPR) repeat protein